MRKHLYLARREILDRQIEAAAVAAHEYESPAIGQMPRRHVVAAIEGHPLDCAAAERQPVDLRRAATVGGEEDRPAVG